MRARHGDAEVCPKCNGTGSRVYVAKGYSFSAPCTFSGFEGSGQRSLLPKPRRATGKKRATGNRRHSKN